MHIAILEDDPSQAELIKQTLLQANYQCSLFNTGKDLMQNLAKNHQFNLAIIDWELPDVSGIDVLHWLRSNLGYSTPVLDRKSTRLNSSHVAISYAVFCLKKKKRMCTL